ncbi:unnamed protein product [Oncorhynchus mykiss]|uniref:Ig-like domain-containing protein n=1 Tax=Oncorhynchus mykiss TaxID=8022 RepID=A0A060Z8H6_ONCMY|nr:unnamed protein product [Oncorhynchus mykiss]
MNFNNGISVILNLAPCNFTGCWRGGTLPSHISQRGLKAVSPTQSSVYNLPKRNLSLSDAGTYYCAVASCGEILFGNGTKLDIQGRNMTVLQQPVPGDSVTLNCTIHTEACVGDHTVYWFRHGSGESLPGFYTHGDRSDQCEKRPEAGSPTQSCVYNLPKRNLSLSDAGTYYCAVAPCGEILFGKGTILDIQGKSHLICKYPQHYCIFVQMAYFQMISFICLKKLYNITFSF